MRKFLVFKGLSIQFLSKLQFFQKRLSALKFPLIATEYYAYNSVSSVKSKKQMTIIFGKMGQKKKKVKMRNFLLNYLRYRDSNSIIIHKDCNRIKMFF